MRSPSTDIYRVISGFFVLFLPLSFLGLLYAYPYAGKFVDNVREYVIERWGFYQYISDIEDNYPQELIASNCVTDSVGESPLWELPVGYNTYPVPQSKFVYVDVSIQRVWCCEDGSIVAYFLTSTGVRERPTPPGDYRIREKIRYAISRRYYEKGETRWWGLPYYVDFGGFGFHAVPTRYMAKKEPMNTLGRPASHRCIRLGYDKLDSVNGKSPAEWFYGWVEIGTPVLIHGEYDFDEADSSSMAY
ncbi:MAG: L,D-transpeptidase [bacterium]|nr:L,D-transpeptidase [bacterium]